MNPINSNTNSIFNKSDQESPLIEKLTGRDTRIFDSAIKAIKGALIERWSADLQQEGGIESLYEKWVIPTPEGTPLSDLVIFKDAYQGLLPLNGIKEKDFKRFNTLLSEIENGRTAMQIVGHKEFKKTIVDCCAALCTREAGRELLGQLLFDRRTSTFNVSEAESGSQIVPNKYYYFLKLPFYRRTTVEIDLKEAHTAFVFSFLPGTQTKVLVPRLLHVTLGHELVHLLHLSKHGDFYSGSPDLNKDFDDLEEQVTITGLERKREFQETEDDSVVDFETPLPSTYDPLNENRISTAFGEAYRIDHHGVMLDRPYLYGTVKNILEDKDHLIGLFDSLSKKGFKPEAALVRDEGIKYLKNYIASTEDFDPEEAQHYAVLALNLKFPPFFEILAKKGIELIPTHEFAKVMDYNWGPSGCARAAKKGRLDVLRWARENGCKWDKKTCSQAAHYNHIDVLKWAHDNGCPWDSTTTLEAAFKGNLGILQWAHEKGCPLDPALCDLAAHNGHLAVLQWAHKEKAEWGESTCGEAALGGHLKVLQWLHQNGCPWDETTCIAALKNGHLDLLKWAHAAGAPLSKAEALAVATQETLRPEVIAWLNTLP